MKKLFLVFVLLFEVSFVSAQCQRDADKHITTCAEGNVTVLWGGECLKARTMKPKKYCENLRLEGIAGWRVPNLRAF